MAAAGLHWGDILTIVIYFVVCIAIGIWSARRTNQTSIKGYFLADRGMSWLPVGASIFSTNVGSHFFIGMAGTAAISGISVVYFEWAAPFCIIILAWFFLPVFVMSGSSTTPEYLKKRFGGNRLGMTLTIMSMILYIVQRVSIAMYSGGVFLQQAVGWDIYLSSFFVIAITAIYTLIGGLAAVIWADTLQTVVMFIGSTILAVIGLIEVGGMEGLVDKYSMAQPNVSVVNNMTCGQPREDTWHIMRHPVTGDFPWPALTFGIMVPGIFVWCNDQTIVQRALAAKDIAHAKGGAILASYFKLVPMIMIVLPGMISRALYPDEVACVDPDICEAVCQNRVGCSNIAYPKLMVKLLPAGLRGLVLASVIAALMSTLTSILNSASRLRGLVLASVIAALMSTLTSILNSASSMFTMDIWRVFRKRASQTELMIVGRVFIVVLVVLSYLWIPILQASSGAQLWAYLVGLISNFMSPWTVVFTLGIFWKRANEQGAFWSMMVGLLMGLVRTIMEFVYPVPACGDVDTRPEVLSKVYTLYFALIEGAVCTVIMVGVSLCTEPPGNDKIYRRTFWTLDYKEHVHDVTDHVSDDVRVRQENEPISLEQIGGDTHEARDEDVPLRISGEGEVGDEVNEVESAADGKPSQEINPAGGHGTEECKDEEDTHRWKKFLKITCCLQTESEEQPPKLTEQYLKNYMNIDWKADLIIKSNVIVLVIVTTFLIGYYG